ncbi:unnamed protein product [Lactuca saligna]|uniref:Uncharacterized protein n=1 Tax=Lactuca saligna TaxID=75948 RepID=A0AA35ZH71_LACSI|nr:unnamed protein product [Lactuca saligna]
MRDLEGFDDDGTDERSCRLVPKMEWGKPEDDAGGDAAGARDEGATGESDSGGRRGDQSCSSVEWRRGIVDGWEGKKRLRRCGQNRKHACPYFFRCNHMSEKLRGVFLI